MQAIQDFYEDGIVKLDKQAPIRKGKIIVLFPDEQPKKMQCPMTKLCIYFINSHEA